MILAYAIESVWMTVWSGVHTALFVLQMQWTREADRAVAYVAQNPHAMAALQAARKPLPVPRSSLKKYFQYLGCLASALCLVAGVDASGAHGIYPIMFPAVVLQTSANVLLLSFALWLYFTVQVVYRTVRQEVPWAVRVLLPATAAISATATFLGAVVEYATNRQFWWVYLGLIPSSAALIVQNSMGLVIYFAVRRMLVDVINEKHRVASRQAASLQAANAHGNPLAPSQAIGAAAAAAARGGGGNVTVAGGVTVGGGSSAGGVGVTTGAVVVAMTTPNNGNGSGARRQTFNNQQLAVPVMALPGAVVEQPPQQALGTPGTPSFGPAMPGAGSQHLPGGAGGSSHVLNHRTQTPSSAVATPPVAAAGPGASAAGGSSSPAGAGGGNNSSGNTPLQRSRDASGAPRGPGGVNSAVVSNSVAVGGATAIANNSAAPTATPTPIPPARELAAGAGAGGGAGIPPSPQNGSGSRKGDGAAAATNGEHRAVRTTTGGAVSSSDAAVAPLKNALCKLTAFVLLAFLVLFIAGYLSIIVLNDTLANPDEGAFQRPSEYDSSHTGNIILPFVALIIILAYSWESKPPMPHRADANTTTDGNTVQPILLVNGRAGTGAGAGGGPAAHPRESGGAVQLTGAPATAKAANRYSVPPAAPTATGRAAAQAVVTVAVDGPVGTDGVGGPLGPANSRSGSRGAKATASGQRAPSAAFEAKEAPAATATPGPRAVGLAPPPGTIAGASANAAPSLSPVPEGASVNGIEQHIIHHPERDDIASQFTTTYAGASAPADDDAYDAVPSQLTGPGAGGPGLRHYDAPSVVTLGTATRSMVGGGSLLSAAPTGRGGVYTGGMGSYASHGGAAPRTGTVSTQGLDCPMHEITISGGSQGAAAAAAAVTDVHATFKPTARADVFGRRDADAVVLNAA